MAVPFYTPNEKMIYVYKLPKDMSAGYCFGQGVPVTFTNVDWFCGHDQMTREELEAYVAKKRYVEPGATYLVCSPEAGISFTFRGV